VAAVKRRLPPYVKRDLRPIIGITCGNNLGSPSRLECYEECVTRAGGDVVFLQPGGEAKSPSERCDGLLLPGGRDIDPFLYGERPLPGTVLEDPQRTEFEFLVLGEIMKQRKPILGICYGMQLINVWFKGSLFQEIRSGSPGRVDHREGSHIIDVRDNPYFFQGEQMVPSSHHQAVRRLGAGLLPWAYAADGIVEGLYSKLHSFLVGVQWHPERVTSPLTTSLFTRFLDACRKR
jgi:putative glutamine amidotransferase